MRVQRYLLAVREGAGGIYNPIDGVFGEQTRQALLAYQRERGLPTSGVGDLVTFDALYEEYTRRADDAPSETDALYASRLTKQMRGEQVRRLNSLLNEYFAFSKEFLPLSVHDYFDTETEERVQYLANLWGMESEGGASRALMRRLSREVGARRQYKKALEDE